MPIPGQHANDYIYSADNIRYSEWKKVFAFFPVITITKHTVWLKTVYKRRRWMLVEPPQFPRHKFNKVEYATQDELIMMKLQGHEV